MDINKNDPRADHSSEEKIDSILQNDIKDHPGMQKISKNPNPRANENLNDTSPNMESKEKGTTDEVGSEITDGEAG